MIIPNKLRPIPKKLFNQSATININEAVLPNGSMGYEYTWEGKVLLVEKSIGKYTPDKVLVQLSGMVYVDGDIYEDKTIGTGEVLIGDRKFIIHRAFKPRNPDGTVHHTEIELI